MKTSVFAKVALVSTAGLLLATGPAYAAAPAYTATFLGALPGAADSSAGGINENGDVAGSSGPHAFLYHEGRLLDLGTLGGVFSSGIAISEEPQVVGQSALPSTGKGGPAHAYRWSDGLMTDLGTLPGGNFSTATAISQSGELVVGVSDTGDPTGFPAGFVWRHGVMRQLPALGPLGSFPTGVNDSGQIVGQSLSSSGGGLILHAFTIVRGVIRDIDPGIPDDTISAATAINQNGAVAMFAFDTQAPHPFVYRHGRYTPIALPAGDTRAIPFAINDSGVAVGISGDVFGPKRAFLSGRGMTLDLNSFLPAGVFFLPAGINDNGQVVGTLFQLTTLAPPQAVLLNPSGEDEGGDRQAARPAATAVRAAGAAPPSWSEAMRLAGR